MEQFTAPFTVLRLLTPLKMSYEAAKKRAEPYTKIVDELPEMQRDTVDLVKKAVGENRKVYVLVNNRIGRECLLDDSSAPDCAAGCGDRWVVNGPIWACGTSQNTISHPRFVFYS